MDRSYGDFYFVHFQNVFVTALKYCSRQFQFELFEIIGMSQDTKRKKSQ